MNTVTEIRFYRCAGPFGFLSNLWPCPVIVEGMTFADAERAYQFGKPLKIEVAEWMTAAATASLCAQIAHALLPWQVRPDWTATKVDRMRLVLAAKFRQNADLATRLVGTADARLMEDSKTDAFWGIGKKGTGKNRLGVLLMELRGHLRSEGIA